LAGGRMAHARAGVDVVGAEGRADQLLHQEGLLVGAARGRDAAYRVAAVPGLDAAELGGRILEGLLPADLAPGIRDALADHRPGDAVLVRGIAVGEAALHAGMATVGTAVTVGDHAHHFLALHLGDEGAAHAAVGAGGLHRVGGLADGLHGLLGQRAGRAALHAGAAGHALGL